VLLPLFEFFFLLGPLHFGQGVHPSLSVDDLLGFDPLPRNEPVSADRTPFLALACPLQETLLVEDMIAARAAAPDHGLALAIVIQTERAVSIDDAASPPLGRQPQAYGLVVSQQRIDDGVFLIIVATILYHSVIVCFVFSGKICVIVVSFFVDQIGS